MFSGIKRFIGNITAEEKDGYITVDGVSADILARDIYKVWSTSRINDNMFKELHRSRFRFPSFFGPEVLYMLQVLADNHRRRTSYRTIDRIVSELKANTWLKRLDQPTESILDFSKASEITLPLLPHQLQFLQMYNRNVPMYGLNGFLLGAVAGSGKTITCLALGACLNADRVIVVSPKHAVYDVWVSTIKAYLTHKASYWVAADGEPMRGKPKYMIYHYETIDQALATASTLVGSKLLIVLDESHNFNEINAQRTQNFVELCRKTKCQNVVWSSGTPVKALGSEAIPMLQSMDPLFTADVEDRFKKIFGSSSARANDILRNRMGFMSFKVLKSDIMPDLKEPVPQDVKVTVPNGQQFTLDAIRVEMRAFIIERLAYYHKHKAQYVSDYETCVELHRKTINAHDKLERFKQYTQNIARIRRGYDPMTMSEIGQYCNRYELNEIIPSLPPEWHAKFKDIRSVVKYVELKVQGECLGRILGKRRADCNVAMVPYAGLEKIIDDAEKKTIVFTSFVEALKATDVFLTARGYKPVVVYGDTNKDLTELLVAFRKDPDANPIIATYQSLSSAVPLIEANVVVLLNQPFRDHERVQAISRANRLGQDTQVEVFNILLDTGKEPNISTRSQEILAWSKQQVEEIMGTKGSVDPTVALEDCGPDDLYLVKDSYQTPRELSW
jgi:hypothetical protein